MGILGGGGVLMSEAPLVYGVIWMAHHSRALRATSSREAWACVITFALALKGVL